MLPSRMANSNLLMDNRRSLNCYSVKPVDDRGDIVTDPILSYPNLLLSKVKSHKGQGAKSADVITCSICLYETNESRRACEIALYLPKSSWFSLFLANFGRFLIPIEHGHTKRKKSSSSTLTLPRDDGRPITDHSESQGRHRWEAVTISLPPWWIIIENVDHVSVLTAK